MFQFKKLFLLVLMCMIAGGVKAQMAESSRTEFIMCKLNDGKTFDDVIENAKVYGEEIKAKGLQYSQYLMRPMMSGAFLEENTHVLVGTWPNGTEMYREYGNYTNSFMDQDDRESPATCNATYATIDYLVSNSVNEDMPMDKRTPVQFSSCKLNEGVSMEDAMQVQKEISGKLIEAGYDGMMSLWATPYLGFEDFEYDFYSIGWWQSFEHRAKIAGNYYTMAAELDAMSDSVITCENARAYMVEELFSNR